MGFRDNEIDLTTPTREYVVPTTVTRNGTAYMGPEVRINAHNSDDAIKRVEQAGHKYNNHFQPRETTKKR
jgi:hypothetical protein